MILPIKYLSLKICGEQMQSLLMMPPDQSIQIKGFDLDFDTLTWTFLGMRNGEMEHGVRWKMVTQVVQ